MLKSGLILLYLICLPSGFPGLELRAFAEPDTPEFELLIDLAGRPPTEVILDKPVKFEAVCADFTKYMIKNQGLWGTGPFKTARCVNSAKNPEVTAAPWMLSIYQDHDKINFDIIYRDKSGETSAESRLALKTELGPITLLANKKTRVMIAAHLSMGLPFRSTINRSAVRQNNVITFPGVQVKDAPVSTVSPMIFRMVRSHGIWRPWVVGRAELATQNPTGLEYRIVLTDSETEAAVARNTQIDTYYVQQDSGRDEARAKLESLLTSDMGSFFKRFLDIGHSAYVGAHFGVPFGKRDKILKNARVLGFFSEFRGGMLDGFKLNYDLIPLQKATLDDTEIKYSWSRIQIGYGAGQKIDTYLFNWVDVTPKLGITNLLLSQSASLNTGDIGYDFELHRAPTIGVEAGAEKRTRYFLARAWTYVSYSLGIIEIDKKYKSSSTRFGFDLYRDIFSAGPVRFALLGFSAYDSSTFARNVSTQELQDNPDMTTKVTISSWYAGGGLTLTW